MFGIYTHYACKQGIRASFYGNLAYRKKYLDVNILKKLLYLIIKQKTYISAFAHLRGEI